MGFRVLLQIPQAIRLLNRDRVDVLGPLSESRQSREFNM